MENFLLWVPEYTYSFELSESFYSKRCFINYASLFVAQSSRWTALIMKLSTFEDYLQRKSVVDTNVHSRWYFLEQNLVQRLNMYMSQSFQSAHNPVIRKSNVNVHIYQGVLCLAQQLSVIAFWTGNQFQNLTYCLNCLLRLDQSW